MEQFGKTKPCVCGKKMIKRYSNRVILTDPPKFPWYWWCGGCRREEEGGIEVGKTDEQRNKEAWERANPQPWQWWRRIMNW